MFSLNFFLRLLFGACINEKLDFFLTPLPKKALTVYPKKVFVEPLCVYCTYILSVGSMKKLSFVVSSIIFVYFLLLYHVLLVKMRILNSHDFLNLHSATGCLKFAHDILVLRGAWVESHSVYYHVRVWHWSPCAWKRYCYDTKQSQFFFSFTLLLKE